MNEFDQVIEKVVAQLSDNNLKEAKSKAETLKEITINHDAKLRMIAWDQQ